MTPELPSDFMIGEDGVVRCAALLELPWLEHGFETRDAAPNLSGFHPARLRQIHSAIVVRPSGLAADCGEGDALITDETARLLSVRTADCVPILLAAVSKHAVAAVHAGWRGVVAGVVQQTIARMHDHFGCRPEDLVAAIGPCIRLDAFAVGPEVAVQFQTLFPERTDLNQRTHIDLATACLRQLVAARVPVGNVYDCGACTFTDAERYHSFRRDREASGRMRSFIGILSPE